MESYRTEEEQVEVLKRWWDENGRSMIAAVILALGVGFGWQGWKTHQTGQAEAASDLYQQLLRSRSAQEAGAEQKQQSMDVAEQLKRDFAGSTYAQFAALHLAAIAVEAEDMAEAEAQLRWILGRADKNSDTGRIAQLRLARVVAAKGDVEQALAILGEGESDAYQGSYALARGDILLAAGREQEARQAYSEAQALTALSGRQLPVLQAKLQHLSPVPPRGLAAQDVAQESSVATDVPEDMANTAPAAEQGEGEQ